MEIKTRTYSFESNYDSVPIHGICMIPEHPVAILQMVHGMCERKERFLPFMQKMAERGYITLMHDNRGHGASVKTENDMGYCYSSKEKGFIEDIYWATKNIRKEYPDLPLILYGHSMGSLAIRAYLRNHDDAIDAIIVSGCPSYNDLVPLGRCLVRILQTITGEYFRSALTQRIVLGSFEKPFRSENRKLAWLTAKKFVDEEAERDELYKFVYTINGFETLLNLEHITYRAKGYQVKNDELPILFISGKDDPCYISEKKWQQAIERMRNLGYKNIKDIRYDGMRHEIHNEENNEIVFDEIDSFCKAIM